MTGKYWIPLILAVSIYFPARASDIIYMTHDIACCTYFDESGELRGVKNGGRRAFTHELTREIRIRLGHQKREYKVMPFKRAMFLILQNQEHLALFSIGRKPHREGKMKWVGPIIKEDIFFYELISAPTGIHTLDDAKSLSVCSGDGGNRDRFLIAKNFLNVVRNPIESACFKMLALKRVALVVASEYGAIPMMKSAGMNPELFQNTSVRLFEVEGYIVFTKKVPDSTIQAWQSTLEAIRLSGTYDKLVDQYLKH